MNPRDKRPGDRRQLAPGGRPGGAVWYVLGFLLLVAMAQTWFMLPGGKQISYSEFKNSIKTGQVQEVFVGEQSIRGTYKRDVGGVRNFNTNRIEDAKLVEDLDTAGVKYTGEFASRWVSELIGWLPLLLLFGVWIFFDIDFAEFHTTILQEILGAPAIRAPRCAVNHHRIHGASTFIH